MVGPGPPKPFVEALWQLTAAMQNAAPFITERYHQVARLPSVVGVFFPCSSILRAVQVGAQEYLHQVSTNIVEGTPACHCRTFVIWWETSSEAPSTSPITGCRFRRNTWNRSEQAMPLQRGGHSGRHQPSLSLQRRCEPDCSASQQTLLEPPSPESRTLRRMRSSPVSKFDREKHATSYASGDHPQTMRDTSFAWLGG